jgi:hypothetical protein
MCSWMQIEAVDNKSRYMYNVYCWLDVTLFNNSAAFTCTQKRRPRWYDGYSFALVAESAGSIPVSVQLNAAEYKRLTINRDTCIMCIVD